MSYDPRLLEDPEWQLALSAVDSEPTRGSRSFRPSPSANAGATRGDASEYYLTGGLSDDGDEINVVDLTSPVHPSPISRVGPQQGRDTGTESSARTTARPNSNHQAPSRASPQQSTANSGRNSKRSHVHISTIDDEDDEVEILHAPNSTRSGLSTGPRPQNATLTTSSQSISAFQDLDRELALQLQRELDGDVDRSVWEVLDDDVQVSSHRPASHNHPQYSSFPTRTRAQRPSGPQRGAAGINRQQSAPLVGNSSVTRPSNDSLSLPPISRARSTPTSPAHTPIPTTTSTRSRGGAANSTASSRTAPPPAPTASYSVQAGSGRTTQAVPPTRPDTLRRSQSNRRDFDDDGDLEGFVVNDEEDDDEMRLRSGVTTRRQIPELPYLPSRNQPQPRLEDIDFFRLVAGRPLDGPGSRRQLLQDDAELARVWQESEYDTLQPRRGRGVPGTGRRNRRQRDMFEVDVNDYDAMLRLSERAPPVKRGASTAVLNSLPIVKASNDDCTICQGTAESVMIALPCLHNFHKECILPHLKTNRFCPNCRHEVE